jgi:hypothetical protein
VSDAERAALVSEVSRRMAAGTLFGADDFTTWAEIAIDCVAAAVRVPVPGESEARDILRAVVDWGDHPDEDFEPIMHRAAAWLASRPSVRAAREGT